MIKPYSASWPHEPTAYSRNGPGESRVSHGNARIIFLNVAGPTGLCNFGPVLPQPAAVYAWQYPRFHTCRHVGNWEDPNRYNTDNFRGIFHKAR
jgi:hypothetical protein